MDLILYGDKYETCFNEGHKEFPRVKFTQLEKGVTVGGKMFCHRIIFLVVGSVEYGVDGKPPTPVGARSMFYVSPNLPISLRAAEQCRLIIIYTEEPLELCECPDSVEDKCYDSGIPGILEIHPRLMLYLTHLGIFHQEGLRCKSYLHTKIREMCCLINTYYGKASCKQFFSLRGEQEHDFSSKIRHNWQRFRTVRQLAEYMNCSESAFTRKFKSVFGESAGHWLTNKRKEAIFYDLTVGQKPLKVLAEKHLFSTQGLFCDFCKNNFGKSPGEIRKYKKKTVISKK